MMPSTPAACLSHIRHLLSEAEYALALARIMQLVAAERAMAQMEADESHLQVCGSLLHKPLSRG